MTYEEQVYEHLMDKSRARAAGMGATLSESEWKLVDLGIATGINVALQEAHAAFTSSIDQRVNPGALKEVTDQRDDLERRWNNQKTFITAFAECLDGLPIQHIPGGLVMAEIGLCQEAQEKALELISEACSAAGGESPTHSGGEEK